MTFPRHPIITRWSEPSERHLGFMAAKTVGTRELVVAEYSERAQDALVAELGRRDDVEREIARLKNRPEVIEGEYGK